jgi:hypothetical protein
VLWSKIGHMRPTCQADRPCNLAGQQSFLLAHPLGIGYLEHRLFRTRRQNRFWKCANKWPTGHTLAQLSPYFMPHHFLMSYFLWLCLILGIIKICMDFGSYGAFLSSDVPEMVDQQNSWNSLVISTYLLYLEWNVGMLAVNICILWPSTPPTLRVLLVPEQKKRIKLWGQ